MARQKRYPIGIQTFSKIIKGDYTYVDKTAFIPDLIATGQYIFLSRPRRFGKSLLLSTLHSYFAGERELFKGLAIDSMDVDWTPRPVIHIDLNPENYSIPDALDNVLDTILRKYEKKYGVEKIENTLSSRFASLLEHINDKTGEKTIILVDEYDKPLLGIETMPDLFTKNQAILKGFFGVLKSSDRHIHFAMLTGVARFNKVSIFSDLNNLRDISLTPRFADLCGWTQKELIDNMSSGIDNLAKSQNISFEEAVNDMMRMYDGYLFAVNGSRLYNPFSVLNALADERLSYFWYQTGTPTFLVKRIRDARISLPSLNNCRATEDQLLSVGIHDPNPIPLLFQTGYLTIKETVGPVYFLHFPNKEVEIGFSRSLLPLYLPEAADLNGEFSMFDFMQDLVGGKPESFMTRMAAMIKSVPYEKQDEALYQNAVYLLFTLIGADARLEEHSNIGRPDLTIRTKDFVYVFEFKYNRSADDAIRQIHDRDYAGRFAAGERTVFLIGANFSKEKHGLEQWIIEKI